MNIRSYLPSFYTVVLIAFLQAFAITKGLYFKVWWYDVMMHFLGGMLVAMSGYWFFYRSGMVRVPKATTRNFLVATLLMSLIVGGLWEIFEYCTGLTYVLPGESYKVDTLCDMGMDTVGALVVYLYYRLKCWKEFI